MTLPSNETSMIRLCNVLILLDANGEATLGSNHTTTEQSLTQSDRTHVVEMIEAFWVYGQCIETTCLRLRFSHPPSARAAFTCGERLNSAGKWLARVYTCSLLQIGNCSGCESDPCEHAPSAFYLVGNTRGWRLVGVRSAASHMRSTS